MNWSLGSATITLGTVPNWWIKNDLNVAHVHPTDIKLAYVSKWQAERDGN